MLILIPHHETYGQSNESVRYLPYSQDFARKQQEL